MPHVEIDGISTHYEVHGSGPPLLMMAHGGFNSVLSNWRNFGAWTSIEPLDHFTQQHTCIIYDRREAGESGGRVEALGWEQYCVQAKGLLDHLGISQAYIMGGCMACNLAVAFGLRYPDTTRGLVLHWPTGGVRWRQYGERNFGAHLAYVREKGLAGAVEMAKEKGGFNVAPEGGPWASVISRDEAFTEGFLAQDVDRYSAAVMATQRKLYDRDTSPGGEPEELMGLEIPAIVIPGHDPFHATSAARYLEECLPNVDYKDYTVPEQTPERVRDWILEFTASH